MQVGANDPFRREAPEVPPARRLGPKKIGMDALAALWCAGPMATQHLPPGAFDSLTDAEQAILRLLTAGHTVKSIAASLGRSEASINERLRDARRKTGVGSSRELARLLAAQENRDRKIDLSPRGCPVDQTEPPELARRHWPKGTLAMLISIPVAAAGLALTIAGSPTVSTAPQAAHIAATEPSPLLGSWVLDTGQMPAATRPRQVTINFGMSPGGQWTTQVTIIAPDGSTTRAQSIAGIDGTPVPITGNLPLADTVSLRKPAPNTLVMTLNKAGAAVATRVYTVDQGLTTMKETIVWANNARPMETAYFTRAD